MQKIKNILPHAIYSLTPGEKGLLIKWLREVVMTPRKLLIGKEDNNECT
jgi:hypothetical protein